MRGSSAIAEYATYATAAGPDGSRSACSSSPSSRSTSPCSTWRTTRRSTLPLLYRVGCHVGRPGRIAPAVGVDGLRLRRVDHLRQPLQGLGDVGLHDGGLRGRRRPVHRPGACSSPARSWRRRRRSTDGFGLNPLLQDPLQIIHPLALYAGYVLYTVPFAIIVGSLIAGDVTGPWLRIAQRWNVIAWIALTAGHRARRPLGLRRARLGRLLGVGPGRERLAAAVAHRHDPAAHRHDAAQARRGCAWPSVIVVMVTFVLCLFGTFLTRSGVISSVHAFGESNLGTVLGAAIAAVRPGLRRARRVAAAAAARPRPGATQPRVAGPADPPAPPHGHHRRRPVGHDVPAVQPGDHRPGDRRHAGLLPRGRDSAGHRHPGPVRDLAAPARASRSPT